MDYKGIKEYLKQDLEGVNALMGKSLSSDIALLDKTNKSVLADSSRAVSAGCQGMFGRFRDGRYSALCFCGRTAAQCHASA